MGTGGGLIFSCILGCVAGAFGVWFGAFTLGSGAWVRGFLGARLVGVGAGVIAGIFCTLGSVAGGGVFLGCVCGKDVALLRIWFIWM